MQNLGFSGVRDRLWIGGAGILLGGVLLILHIHGSWVWYGWWCEQDAIAWVRQNRGSVYTETTGPQWLVERLPESLRIYYARTDTVIADDPALGRSAVHFPDRPAVVRVHAVQMAVVGSEIDSAVMRDRENC